MPGQSEDGRAGWVAAVLASHEDRLLRYVMHLTGDLEQARDIVQEAMLRLWQADAAALRDRVTPWLYTVCRNSVMDVRRKAGRVTITANGQMEDRVSGAPPRMDPERIEAKSAAIRALAQLPQRQQEVLRLKFQHGLSYKEISAVTKLSVSHVGVLIHNAIKALRERLEAGDLSADPPPHRGGHRSEDKR